MKVTQNTGNPVQSSQASGARKSEKSAATAKTGGADKAQSAQPKTTVEGSAKTEISSRAKEMAQVKAAAAEAPETREEKIAALKARIAGGNYKVDSAAVADRMVDEHLSMSGIG